MGGERLALIIITLSSLLNAACPGRSVTTDGSGDGGPVPPTAWIAGGTGSEVGLGIWADRTGNSTVTGHFSGTAIFGSTTLTSKGGSDLFVAKLDSSGEWLWATSASGGSRGHGIAVDSSGNSYITGNINDTASFGSTTLTSRGGEDLFVAKLDSTGKWIWAVSAGGTTRDDGYGIAVDGTGASYVTGRFFDTASIGSASLTSKGLGDLFVAKLDSTGKWMWAVSAGGSGDDRGNDIAVDSEGNSTFTGRSIGPVSFGSTTLPGGRGIIVAKLDSTGRWLWAVSAGSGGHTEVGEGIALDSEGNVHVTGDFQDTATFGATSLTAKGLVDVFVAKLDSAGHWQWAVSTGTVNVDHGTGISVDDAGNSTITGTLIDPVIPNEPVESEIFVAKLDSTGRLLWTLSTEHSSPGSYTNFAAEIAVDGAGNSYATGTFSGTAAFGSTTLTAGKRNRVFVWRVSGQGD
jgi:hypothetical protein